MSTGSSGVNPAYSLQSVQQAPSALLSAIDAASNGKRITSAAVDPSGLAIYTTLTTQSQGADAANENITTASDAAGVAQGAVNGVQAALSQLNATSIEADNGFNSPADTAALQAQANQLVQQINTDAGDANFNGTPLLNGTNSGSTPPSAASAAITSDGQTNAGGGVVASVAASSATTNGTFIATVNAAGTADVSYTDSATQSTASVGSFAAGTSTTYGGTTIAFGSFDASDAGTSATVQATAATAGSTQSTVSLQSGPNEGQTTNISLPDVTSAGLGIQNIDLTTSAGATNAQGQIDGATAALATAGAGLGAQSASLAAAFANNATLSNNLTGAASALQQISFAVLTRANTDAGHLNSFLSQYA